MKADQSLFVLDLNERRSDSTNLVWSIGQPALCALFSPVIVLLKSAVGTEW